MQMGRKKALQVGGEGFYGTMDTSFKQKSRAPDEDSREKAEGKPDFVLVGMDFMHFLGNGKTTNLFLKRMGKHG